MDERMIAFLEFITAHELESYLSEDGLRLIEEMRKRREEERYENWLDQCEDMGVDRELARSLSRRDPPKRPKPASEPSYNGFLCPYCGEDICVCPAR